MYAYKWLLFMTSGIHCMHDDETALLSLQTSVHEEADKKLEDVSTNRVKRVVDLFCLITASSYSRRGCPNRRNLAGVWKAKSF